MAQIHYLDSNRLKSLEKSLQPLRPPLWWRVIEWVGIPILFFLFWAASWGTLWTDEEREDDVYLD